MFAAGRWRLLGDLAVGQRLLQVGDARRGDLGAVERERLQVGKPLEMLQSRVGDLGAVEVERLQAGQPAGSETRIQVSFHG